MENSARESASTLPEKLQTLSSDDSSERKSLEYTASASAVAPPSSALEPSLLPVSEVYASDPNNAKAVRSRGSSKGSGDKFVTVNPFEVNPPQKNSAKSFLTNFPKNDFLGSLDLIPKKLKTPEDSTFGRDARVAKKMKDIEDAVEDEMKQSEDISAAAAVPASPPAGVVGVSKPMLDDAPEHSFSESISQSGYSQVRSPNGRESQIIDPKEIMKGHRRNISASKSHSQSRSYTPSQVGDAAGIEAAYFSRISQAAEDNGGDEEDTMLDPKKRNVVLLNKTKFVKHGRYGYPHYRHIRIDIDTGEISWGKSSRKRESLLNLLEVIEGKESKVFQRKAAEVSLARRCFTLVFRGNKQLNLEAMTSNHKAEWIACLKDLQKDLILKSMRKGLATPQAGRISKS
eukprot:TRINITY_DN2288_c0_g1_i1.p1 TRINITY_DN2288_c0_g1~~TRINITY_DN2288_c0_g1_i1.p1  ORF type:complete len:401 (+),score=106.39 TRINITY_DN2288_c0_g1_i1:146-1348(+)